MRKSTGLVLLVCLATPWASAAVTPGQLDVVEMTAVELDGRLPGGIDPLSFSWKITKGEGGKLFAADQPPSTRSVRIRVMSSNPPAAADDGTEWLDDFYRDAKKVEESRERSPMIVVPGNTGSSVTMGFGMGGWRGGMGYRWSMSYPISQPVVVPPPGVTYRPGEGTWEPARPVPYDELHETLPCGISDRYRLIDDPEAKPQEVEVEEKGSDRN